VLCGRITPSPSVALHREDLCAPSLLVDCTTTQDRVHDPGNSQSTCEAPINLQVEINTHDLIVGVESGKGDLVIAYRV
jgi:hypothetical protein